MSERRTSSRAAAAVASMFKKVNENNAAAAAAAAAEATTTTPTTNASKAVKDKKEASEQSEESDNDDDIKDKDFGAKSKKATTTKTTTVKKTTTKTAAAAVQAKGTKRKVVEEEDEQETVTTTTVTKKVATGTAKGGKVPIRPDAPVNMTMPNPLVLPATPEGCIKITSWNVSGLNASLKKGFKIYIEAEDADLICIQEHKVNEPMMNLLDPKKYPFSWWGFEKDKKGYAGVAMFGKTKPINVTAGLPTHPKPEITKGRIVTLEYPTTFVLGCYVPNAGQELVRLPERQVWDIAMKEWLVELKSKGKQIIWTGDLNVCHQPIDLSNPKTNTRSAGFTKEERDGFQAILDTVDLVDTFRDVIPGNKEAVGYYSYYSYRFQCRVKGIGWRLDYYVTDKEMAKRVKENVIRETCYGASDHLPIVLVVEGSL